MADGHNEEKNLDLLYREVLFEHYKRPRNKGPLEHAEIVTKGNNPLCGDKVTLYGKLDADGKFESVHFDGKGCAICIASTSMMTDLMRGLTVEEAQKWAERFKKMMRSDEKFEAPAELPDLEALEGVKQFPVRVKCATLAWTTLANGILAYKSGQSASETNTEKEA